MSITYNPIVIRSLWTTFKTTAQIKNLAIQYESRLSSSYEIFALDGDVRYSTTIFVDVIPSSSDYNGNQSQNDVDRTDFETNYQPYVNKPISYGRRVSSASLSVTIASDQIVAVTGSVALSEAPLVRQGTTPWIITGSVGVQGPVLTAGTDGTGAVIPIRTDASGNLQISSLTVPAGADASISFGDITVAAPGTYAVRRTTYTEQSTNFQGSIKSSAAADSAAGTGARTVRITYLTSAGVGPLTEDITLNGVTAVNFVNTDHCFIEKIEILTVGSGLVNAGTITLNAGLAGAGTVVGTIAIGNNQTFWCHHYTPAGKTTFVAGTLVANSSTVVGGGCTFVLRSLSIPTANKIDKQVGDTFTLYGQSSQTPRNFTTAVPLAVGPARLTMYAIVISSTSIVYRASFDFYDK